jgi:RNA polymerase primary sigma factor
MAVAKKARTPHRRPPGTKVKPHAGTRRRQALPRAATESAETDNGIGSVSPPRTPDGKHPGLGGRRGRPPAAASQFEDGAELDLLEPSTEIAESDAVVPEEDLLAEEALEERQPELAAELADDPVRLYLREIGEVKLLDVDSEFRLATLIEAKREISVLRSRPVRRGTAAAIGGYHRDRKSVV